MDEPGEAEQGGKERTMKEIWRTFRNRLAVKIATNGVSVEHGYQYVEAYFAQATDRNEVLTTFHRARAILVGRKLLRKERSDKGSPRVGKIGMPSDAGMLADRVMSTNGGETA